jgi:hypothetical protein
MTDFLMRLAERTIGMAKVAKPLIPSMFDKGSIHSVSDQFFENRSESREDNMDATQFRETPVLITEQRSAPSELYNYGLPSKKISGMVADKQPVTRDDDGDALYKRFEVNISSPEKKTGHDSIPVIRKPEKPDNIYSGAYDKEKSSKPMDKAAQKPDYTPGKKENLPDIVSIKQHADKSEQPPGVSDHKKVYRPEVSTYKEPPGHLPSKHDITLHKSALTAPTVRVTIGRIEVRAVMQQSHPLHRSLPVTPKMSLEDYLKSRNGGQR